MIYESVEDYEARRKIDKEEERAAMIVGVALALLISLPGILFVMLIYLLN